MIALEIILYILSALTGLAVGSFLNVCIYRLPRGNFFSKARSFCPKCNTPIKAYDNIPLISYIILRGRCRACHERISPRYPIIEALNMILWIVNFAVFKISYLTLVYDVLVSTLIVVAMIDYDTTEIPDSSIITIIILALLTFIPVFNMSWQSKLIGAFCVSVPMLIIAFFGGMGFGDVKLYFALGLLFGWEYMLIIFILSFIFGSIYGIGNMIYLRHKENGEEEAQSEDMADISPARCEIEAKNGDNASLSTPCEDMANEGEIAKKNVDILLQNMARNESENAAIISDDKACQDSTHDCSCGCGERGKICDSQDMSSEDMSMDEDAKKLDDYERKLEEKIDTGKAIPFGPFIVLATFITMYAGGAILDFYKGLLGF